MHFSVVIPLYNKSRSIERSICSVLGQTYQNFELIIINDGSTDESSKKAMAFEDPRIRVVDQVNQGVSVARNVGVEHSRFELICFLDADDTWDSDHLERILSLVADYPNAVLYSTGHRINENGMSYGVSSKAPPGFRGYLTDFFSCSLSGDIVNSSKVAVRRQPFAKLGGFPVGVTVGEDLYVWTKLALLGLVAHDTSVTVTVNIQYDAQRVTRRAQVPYLLTYYALHKGELSDHPALKKYVERVGIKHVAGSSIDRDYKGGLSRVVALCRINLFLGVSSLVFMMIPNSILGFFRARNRDADD